MTFCQDIFLIVLHMEQRFSIRSICHRCDHAAGPVEVFGRDFTGRVGKIFRCLIHIRIERNHRVKCIRCVSHPFQRSKCSSSFRAHLDQRHKIISVDIDGSICTAHGSISIGQIRVIRCSLIMCRQYIFYIFRRDLLFRNHAPRNVIGQWCVIGVRTVPVYGIRIQIPFHVPGSRRIVYMVGIVMASEGISWIQNTVHGKIQMVFFDKFFQVRGAHVFFLLAQCVLQIKCIDAQLVRHYHIHIIRHFSCHPVMSADCLQPPDLVSILESDSIIFICSIRFQKMSQSGNTLAGALNIRKHQAHDVFLSDTTRYFFLTVFCRLIYHQRIGALYTRVGCDRFGGCHGYICLIDTACCPDAFSFFCIWHGCIAHRLFRQFYFHMGEHGNIGFRLFFGCYHHELFRCKMSGSGVVVAGDHCGSVVGCFFTY